MGYTTLFEEDNIFNPFVNHSMKMTSVTVFTTSVTQSWKILQQCGFLNLFPFGDGSYPCAHSSVSLFTWHYAGHRL